jgi:integrase
MKKTEWINLDDGLAIFKKPTSQNWYYWLKFEGIETRKTTKIKEMHEAKKFAFKQQARIEILVEAGLPPIELKSSIKSIYNKVIVELERKKTTTVEDYKRHLERINEDFGTRNIKNIIGQDFKNFIHKHNINSSTQLRNVKYSFNLLYNYAIDNNIIENQHKLNYPKIEINTNNNSRDYFKDDEFKIIDNSIESFQSSQLRKNETTRINRILFKWYIYFLYYSGLRSGEETKATWGDIKKIKDGYYSIKITKGKTSKFFKREIPIRRELFLVLQLLSDDIYGNCDVEEKIKNYKNTPIFLNTKTNKIFNHEKIWIQFKNHIGNKIDFTNKSLYSFRHTYACKMIMGMDKNNYTYTDIAKFMGTSEEMLKKHYDHIVSMDKVEKLVNWEFQSI